MKPLLVLPPCSARWKSVEMLLGSRASIWLEDLKRRFVDGVEGAQDAFALIADGGHVLSHACICRRKRTGVLDHMFTRPDHRRRGHMRRLVQTLIEWFDMTGGDALYAAAEPAMMPGLFEPLGFRVLHRQRSEPTDSLFLLRTRTTPAERPAAADEVRELTRADWPELVALFQHHAGPDPRVAMAESAVAAPLTTLDWLRQQEQGVCRLLGVFSGDRLTAAATLAIDQLGQRTYAMMAPPSRDASPLREAVARTAAAKGYAQVDYPLEALLPPA